MKKKRNKKRTRLLLGRVEVYCTYDGENSQRQRHLKISAVYSMYQLNEAM